MTAVGAESAVARTLSAGGVDLPIVASVFTPYQLLFLERIWAAIPPRPLLLLDQRAQRFRDGRAPGIKPDDYMWLPLTGKVNDAGQARLIRQAMARADAFSAGKPFAYLNASMQWPINTVFYTRHRRNPLCHFAIIEDGLSTYLPIERSRRERYRNIAREIIARLRGFPRRRSWRGHPLGLDLPEIVSIIVGAEPIERGRRPYVLLPPPPSHSLAFDPNGVVLLGQPYMETYSEERMRAFLTMVRANLVSRGYRKLAVKPHHYQYPPEVKIYTDLGFEVIDPPVTVEEMIPDSPYRTIAAINSTGLLAVKSLYGEAVHSIAYNPSTFVPRHESRYPGDVERVFRRAGVEIVAFPQA